MSRLDSIMYLACENTRHIVPTLSKGVWNGIMVQRITKFEVLRDKAKKSR